VGDHDIRRLWSPSQTFSFLIGVLSFSDNILALASGEVSFPSSRKGGEWAPIPPDLPLLESYGYYDYQYRCPYIYKFKDLYFLLDSEC